MCFGSGDDSVGEGEALLFGGTEGEGEGGAGEVEEVGEEKEEQRKGCTREERQHRRRFGSRREEE